MSNVIPATDNKARAEPALIPAVDVLEDSTGITLYADLPGVPRERLKLHVEGDTLLIEADFALPSLEGLQSRHAEVQRQLYRRSFTLSRELDAGKVAAELNQGVLRVRIPKLEQAQPRRIDVQVA